MDVSPSLLYLLYWNMILTLSAPQKIFSNYSITLTDNKKKRKGKDKEKKTREDFENPRRTTVDFLADRQIYLEQKKVEIGCLATNYLDDPENRVSFMHEHNLVHIVCVHFILVVCGSL